VREVRIGETVAVQRISVTVRDGEWGTVPSVLKNLRVDAGRNRFALSFDASSRSHSVDFRWRGLLEGLPDGTISFSFEGEALRDFLKNRIGFCILHPATCAGLPCRFQTTDGTRGTGFLPRDVVPHQPFMDLRSFGHEVFPGTWARLDFQGDIFEMEDQRNWSDGSFKTYCTPLALPFPVQARAGMRIEQRITLSFEGTPIEQAPRTRVRRSVASIEAGPPTGGRLCRLGLGLGDDRLPQEWYREIMEGITPDHIRVECDLDLDDWEDSLGHKLAIVRGLDAPLWCLVRT
jgi:hypothetical protein